MTVTVSARSMASGDPGAEQRPLAPVTSTLTGGSSAHAEQATHTPAAQELGGPAAGAVDVGVVSDVDREARHLDAAATPRPMND